MSDRVLIFDTTLRDGEQSPGASMNQEEKLSIARLLQELKVDIIDSKTFWIAEKYHQDFAVKNPLKYNFYRNSCGRDNRLKKVWGDKNLLFKDL